MTAPQVEIKAVMGKIGQKVKSQQMMEEGDKKDHIINPQFPRCRQQRQISRTVIVHNLPALRDTAPANRSKLLSRKVRLCSYVFSFTDNADSTQDAKDKEVKRSTLLELVNYLTVFKPNFTEPELIEIFEMLSFNLFRPLPPSSFETNAVYNPEEDEPISETHWPHLQVVYEFLLRLATSTETDSKLMDKFFSRQFVLNLLELFDSEDPRERDYLKTILHRIYGNFMALRPFIRRAINNVFYKFIYETDRHNGIAELLEILGSIINGFALPLKEQHKQFLQRVLLPLHKVTYVSTFHPQLSYCVTQFLEKDPSLAPKVIQSILKFWPATCSKKELMFLNELEEILDRIQSHHLGTAQLILFKKIAACINSPHFQVSERAIYVLNNDIILRFVTNNREALVPILAKALYCNTWLVNDQTKAEGKAAPLDKKGAPLQRWRERGHWNPTIVDLTNDIIKLFNEMDANLMGRYQKGFVPEIQNAAKNVEKKRDRWEEIDQVARKWKEQNGPKDPHELKS